MWKIFSFFCCCSPDQASILETQAKEAAKAYSEYSGTESRVKESRLDATIVHYSELLQSFQETDTRYLPTKFTLANYHLEAGEMKMDPQRHFADAKTLYLEIAKKWKSSHAKYPELMCKLGQVHYDLFEIEAHKKENGVSLLQEACRFYDGYLVSDVNGRDDSTSFEVQLMRAVIIYRKCELENKDIKLDEAIKYLSTVFKFDTTAGPSILNNPVGWHNTPVCRITSQLALAIDRNPRSSRVRDLSLLALSQAFLLRYNLKRIGDLFDLQRSEAVANSAILIVSPELKHELEKILGEINSKSPRDNVIDPAYVRGTSTKSPMKTPNAEQSNGVSFTSSVGDGSQKYTPATETTPFSSRIEQRNDPKNNASRAALPIGPVPSSPPLPANTPRTGQRSSSAVSTKGKPKKPLSVQPPPTSYFHIPPKSSPVNKSPTSPNSHH